MVWNYVGQLLGNIGGLFSSSSKNTFGTFASSQAGVRLQQQYNKELAEQSFGYSKKLMDYQNQLEHESRRSSFQDTRYDLEKAGYNPLLALGQQSNYLPVGATQQPVDSNAVSSAIGSINDIKRTASDIESSKYQNMLNLAMTEKTRSEATGQDINNAIQDKYGMQTAKANLDYLVSQGELTKKQANKILADISFIEVQKQYTSAQTQLAKSQTYLNDQEGILQDSEVRFAKSHPLLHGTLRKIGNPVSAVAGGLGLGLAFSRGKNYGSNSVQSHRARR